MQPVYTTIQIKNILYILLASNLGMLKFLQWYIKSCKAPCERVSPVLLRQLILPPRSNVTLRRLRVVKAHGTCQLCLRMKDAVTVFPRLLLFKRLSGSVTIMDRHVTHHKTHDMYIPSSLDKKNGRNWVPTTGCPKWW